jgi:hypothetical protein
MAYLLDANVFIQAKRLHYGMDFCPAFWDWLCVQNQAGKVFSIEKVADELVIGGDDLSNWADKRGIAFFLPPDHQMLSTLAVVGQWVQNQDYTPSAISHFLQDAYYYLIAYALAYNHIVVTHEVASDGIKQVKIPNVCIGLKIKCMTPFAMLSVEKARFILENQGRNITT